MAGLQVVAVKTLPDGNLDLGDLKAKAEQHKDNLAAFMVCIRLIKLVIYLTCAF
jgi:glycine dehydrogenase